MLLIVRMSSVWIKKGKTNRDCLQPFILLSQRFVLTHLNVREILLNNWKAPPLRSQRLLGAVQKNATRGNPHSVLNAIDQFCRHTEWAMNVGDEKGADVVWRPLVSFLIWFYCYQFTSPTRCASFWDSLFTVVCLCPTGCILDSVVSEVNPTSVLELGTYCGYSTVRIARLLPSHAKLITLEFNPDFAAIARQVISWAGVEDKVKKWDLHRVWSKTQLCGARISWGGENVWEFWWSRSCRVFGKRVGQNVKDDWLKFDYRKYSLFKDGNKILQCIKLLVKYSKLFFFV